VKFPHRAALTISSGAACGITSVTIRLRAVGADGFGCGNFDTTCAGSGARIAMGVVADKDVAGFASMTVVAGSGDRWSYPIARMTNTSNAADIRPILVSEIVRMTFSPSKRALLRA
jgi:hypothetical protein